jgi:hypothetical protein
MRWLKNLGKFVLSVLGFCAGVLLLFVSRGSFLILCPGLALMVVSTKFGTDALGCLMLGSDAYEEATAYRRR